MAYCSGRYHIGGEPVQIRHQQPYICSCLLLRRSFADRDIALTASTNVCVSGFFSFFFLIVWRRCCGTAFISKYHLTRKKKKQRVTYGVSDNYKCRHWLRNKKKKKCRQWVGGIVQVGYFWSFTLKLSATPLLSIYLHMRTGKIFYLLQSTTKINRKNIYWDITMYPLRKLKGNFLSFYPFCFSSHYY